MKKKFKKAAAVILTMAMTMSVGIPTFAAEETATAYMRNVTTGEIVPILCTAVDTPMIAAMGNEYAQTYEYYVPTDALRGVELPGRVDGLDDSYSVHGYLTIWYKQKNTPVEYLLTGVEGRWDILDSSVSVVGAEAEATCTGTFPEPTEQFDERSVTNNFSYDTGFTDYVTTVAGGSVGATLTIYITHNGNHVWELNIPKYRP